jgi:putative molybdenum carrier protein
MKVLSGGQSGVDRAVLDVALARGLPYGGWCPQGGWAEDFPAPPGLLAKYPHLKETPLADPAQRTEWNVRDADACLILVDAGGVEVSAGTMLAGDLAQRYRKPLLVADLREPDILDRAAPWLHAQRAAFGAGFTLAIGGPRESEAPGIYERASRFIGALLDAKSALST